MYFCGQFAKGCTHLAMIDQLMDYNYMLKFSNPLIQKPACLFCEAALVREALVSSIIFLTLLCIRYVVYFCYVFKMADCNLESRSFPGILFICLYCLTSMQQGKSFICTCKLFYTNSKELYKICA